MDTNTATIIGGFLSMAGGMVGAAGAYAVATYQTKKQFDKQDTDRVLELRVEKLNEALNIVNDYLHQVQKVKGKILSIEIYVKESREKYTHMGENEVLSKGIVDGLLKEIKEFATYKDSLKKFKIFISSNVNFQEIYDTTSEAIDNFKLFLKQFEGFPQAISVKELTINYDELNLKCDKSYKQLEGTLENTINLLETEILALLKIK